MPKRIQRKRTKGSRIPQGAVYVGRPSFWGNPYTLEKYDTLALALYRNTVQGNWNPSIMDGCADGLISDAYKAHVEWRARARHITIREIERLLGGVDLACWCPLESPCHADILLELANRRSTP